MKGNYDKNFNYLIEDSLRPRPMLSTVQYQPHYAKDKYLELLLNYIEANKKEFNIKAVDMERPDNIIKSFLGLITRFYNTSNDLVAEKLFQDNRLVKFKEYINASIMELMELRYMIQEHAKTKEPQGVYLVAGKCLELFIKFRDEETTRKILELLKEYSFIEYYKAFLINFYHLNIFIE
jgi:hypothetical protein